ncbi:MAG: HAD-IIB family hydrolase [Eubacteriales bacterium]|nr:HAD-IIB family hydrolase [Eubacteriales bacterium]MDD3883102.1 HAD-IIB family hydrolase [Eubacteriales bacterium]MDD4513328.1 HAD-IIB family hydrolase [Eubacteriales bacterium]
MRTLYVSDLDGTLLRKNARTSEFTNSVINSLTEKGMIFSYATARSLITAKKAASGIRTEIPLIVYNGAFVVGNATGEILIANYFDASASALLDDLFSRDIFPIVYAHIGGAEKFTYLPDKCTKGVREFADSRRNDIRKNTAASPQELKNGNIFYITCIDEPSKLAPVYEKYRQDYHSVYQRDIYSGEQWLEIMPKAASKSSAAMQLKKLLGCEKIVAFGDGKNDIDLFEAADECYAVENAVSEQKRKATAVIESNEDDGVAKWLQANFFCGG